MNSFYFLALILLSKPVWAQQSFFTPDNKIAGISYYKDKIYRGCSDLKEKQDPVPQEEMQVLATYTKNLVGDVFFKSFLENPKVKDAFHQDVETLANDSSCQRVGNDCRARLLALSIYYYQTLRADTVACNKYFAKPAYDKNFRKDCEEEIQLRTHPTARLSKIKSDYKKILVKLKNNLTSDLFKLIMQKDRNNLYICNSVQNEMVHKYALELDEPGEYYVGLDPKHDPNKTILKDCAEDRYDLHKEFIEMNFDEGRSTLGKDQVEPLRLKISEYVRTTPEIVVTDIIVTSSSSKTPLYATVDGKKIIDPKSDEKNLSIATERSKYVSKLLEEIKASNSRYNLITFESRAELAGPDFHPMDLNNRFVTKMSPGYIEKIDALYKKHEKEFLEKAFMESTANLMNEKLYSNLYQAKFKPFHGFSILIRGYKKEDMKCSDFSEVQATKPFTSKQ